MLVFCFIIIFLFARYFLPVLFHTLLQFILFQYLMFLVLSQVLVRPQNLFHKQHFYFLFFLIWALNRFLSVYYCCCCCCCRFFNVYYFRYLFCFVSFWYSSLTIFNISPKSMNFLSLFCIAILKFSMSFWSCSSITATSSSLRWF